MNKFKASKSNVTHISTNIFALLLIVLGINTLRYGTYLLEGSAGVYNWVLFVFNLFSLILIVILKVNGRIKIFGPDGK
ncbi:hypothetical protein JNUCC1_02714 [Lentibacillus sp. JNUCC-1]|uniref:hypothetical protein n=1 Tax=Lentibacillus sp. JNUCC-1 TaxID=2654513 RepID=UPI0012E903D0|nr:hypothetical protein [Lentibacillus sp. JNUCC-1]MUV38843.1 hypothetical protein [Lentibacillus sp. JNUCC-1]